MLYGRYAPDSSVKIFLLSGFRSASLSILHLGFRFCGKNVLSCRNFLHTGGKRRALGLFCPQIIDSPRKTKYQLSISDLTMFLLTGKIRKECKVRGQDGGNSPPFLQP